LTMFLNGHQVVSSTTYDFESAFNFIVTKIHFSPSDIFYSITIRVVCKGQSLKNLSVIIDHIEYQLTMFLNRHQKYLLQPMTLNLNLILFVTKIHSSPSDNFYSITIRIVCKGQAFHRTTIGFLFESISHSPDTIA